MARLFKGSPTTKKIAFFPQLAAPWYNIWSVVQLTGLRVTTDLHDADFIFVFEDSTYTNAAGKLPTGLTAKLINHKIDNIGKEHVASVFRDVFGYDLSIDPTTYKGRAIRKSQTNGTHDGIEIDCPISPDDVISGYAYQKLIDSTFTGETSEDLRVVCSLGELPIVFHKHKAIEKRFGTEYISVDIFNPDDVFSDDEIKKLTAFCEKSGLDFGAVDVMRDKNDSRIYVVDVNKTCMPVLSLPFGKQIEAYRKISRSFSTGLGL